MSECVVRMEMPNGCHDCKLMNMIGNCPIPKFEGLDEKKMWTLEECFKRPPWCPIICSLPKGHGRLIDADSMEKDLNYDVELDAKALDDMSIVGYARERFQFDKNRKQDCIRYLSGQKTIVPAERKEI